MGGLRKEAHTATLEQIAEAEGISVGAAHMCLSRALQKLRRQGLLQTCRVGNGTRA
jgi:DNA-directed RNA polymerase specialized sigma24 family protein